MKITNVATPDANDAGSPAPSAASSAFSDILSTVKGGTDASNGSGQHQAGAVPADAQARKSTPTTAAAPDGQAPKTAQAQMPVPSSLAGQPKDAAANASDGKYAAVGLLQPEVEGDEAIKGSGEGFEYQKPSKSDNKLVDFIKGMVGSSDKARDGDPVQADVAEEVLPQAPIEPAKTGIGKSARRAGDRVTAVDPQQATAEAGQPQTGMPPLAVPAMAKVETIEALAEPEWAHEHGADQKATDLIEAPQGPQAALSAVVTPTFLPAIAPAAAVLAATHDGQASVDAADGNLVAAQVVHTLHALDVLDSSADEKEVKVVEGEVIDPQTATPDLTSAAAPANAADKSVHVDVRGAVERLPRPVNLGKPVLAMATQETLQESVSDRQDGVTPNPFGVMNVQAAAAPGAPSTRAAPLPQQASVLQHVVIATTDKKLVPDLGAQIVRSADAGKTDVSIRLDPASLGRIEIHMSFGDDGRMRAVIAADNPSTYDMLKKDANVLAQTLSNAGVKTGASDLRFDMRQGGNQSDRQQNSPYGLTSNSKNGGEDVTERPTTTRSTRGRLV